MYSWQDLTVGNSHEDTKQQQQSSRLCGHLQKTLYTALYWGGSCWRGRRPPCETPASPCTASVKTSGATLQRGRPRTIKGSSQLACSHPGYANLLDDILASILFGFHEDRLPEGALADFLHLFVLVHVNTLAGSSCCGCTARSTALVPVIWLISYRHRHLALKQIMTLFKKGNKSNRAALCSFTFAIQGDVRTAVIPRHTHNTAGCSLWSAVHALRWARTTQQCKRNKCVGKAC